MPFGCAAFATSERATLNPAPLSALGGVLVRLADDTRDADLLRARSRRSRRRSSPTRTVVPLPGLDAVTAPSATVEDGT